MPGIPEPRAVPLPARPPPLPPVRAAWRPSPGFGRREGEHKGSLERGGGGSLAAQGASRVPSAPCLPSAGLQASSSHQHPGHLFLTEELTFPRSRRPRALSGSCWQGMARAQSLPAPTRALEVGQSCRKPLEAEGWVRWPLLPPLGLRKPKQLFLAP